MAYQPAAWAALLTSIAALLTAVAWPGVAAWFLFAHRARIAILLKVFARKLSTAKKFKAGPVEVEAADEAVREAVIDARSQISDVETSKSIPQTQLKAAVSLDEKISSSDLSESRVIDSVRRQIYELAKEYEEVRATPRGHLRTRKMNEIAAAMRTLAIAGLPLRTELTKSTSVGRRLAAICMLQIEPRPRYFRWLIDRIKTEDQPFVFYQAAVAVLELVKKGFYVNPDDTRSAINDSLRVISAFNGQPDQNTLDVLNEALSLVR